MLPTTHLSFGGMGEGEKPLSSLPLTTIWETVGSVLLLGSTTELILVTGAQVNWPRSMSVGELASPLSTVQ